MGREEPPYAVRGGSLAASEVKKDPSGISDSRKIGSYRWGGVRDTSVSDTFLGGTLRRDQTEHN